MVLTNSMFSLVSHKNMSESERLNNTSCKQLPQSAGGKRQTFLQAQQFMLEYHLRT